MKCLCGKILFYITGNSFSLFNLVYHTCLMTLLCPVSLRVSRILSELLRVKFFLRWEAEALQSRVHTSPSAWTREEIQQPEVPVRLGEGSPGQHLETNGDPGENLVSEQAVQNETEAADAGGL